MGRGGRVRLQRLRPTSRLTDHEGTGRQGGNAGGHRGAAATSATAGQVRIVEPRTGGASSPQTWTYTPNTITVGAGTKLASTHTGEPSHTVTADDAAFDSGTAMQ
jgi:plastocyanin